MFNHFNKYRQWFMISYHSYLTLFNYSFHVDFCSPTSSITGASRIDRSRQRHEVREVLAGAEGTRGPGPVHGDIGNMEEEIDIGWW